MQLYTTPTSLVQARNIPQEEDPSMASPFHLPYDCTRYSPTNSTSQPAV